LFAACLSGMNTLAGRRCEHRGMGVDVARVSALRADAQSWIPRLPVSTLLADSMFQPAKARLTLVDAAELSGLDVRRRITFTFDPACEPPDSPSYLALVRPVKGRAIRELAAEGRTGARLRVLSTRDTQAITAALIILQIGRVYDLAVADIDAWPSDVLGLADVVLARILAQPEASLDREARDARLADLEIEYAQRIGESGAGDPLNEGLRRALGHAMAQADVRQFLLVEVPPDDRGVVSYTQRDVVSPAAIRSGWRAPARLLAVALGALPNHLELPIYKARQAGEYALEFSFQSGSYIHSIELEDAAAAEVLVSCRGSGTRHARFGVVDGICLPKKARLAIELRERPEGSFLRAVLLTVLVSAMLLGLRIAGHQDGSSGLNGLGLLSSLAGTISVALVAVWAVVGRTLEGRAFAPGSLVSALASSVSALIGVLAFLRDDDMTILNWVVAFSVLQTLAVALAWMVRVVKLQRLRLDEADRDPESALLA
jgi:hypothetical protein